MVAMTMEAMTDDIFIPVMVSYILMRFDQKCSMMAKKNCLHRTIYRGIIGSSLNPIERSTVMYSSR